MLQPQAYQFVAKPWLPEQSDLAIGQLAYWNALMCLVEKPHPFAFRFGAYSSVLNFQFQRSSIPFSLTDLNDNKIYCSADLLSPSNKGEQWTVLIHFKTFPFAEVFGLNSNINLNELSECPGEIRHALCEGMFDFVLSALPRPLNDFCSFNQHVSSVEVAEGHQFSGPEALEYFDCEISGFGSSSLKQADGDAINDAPTILQFSVGVPKTAVTALVQSGLWQIPEDSNSKDETLAFRDLLKQAISVPCVETLGHCPVNISDLQGLEAGDFLFLKEPAGTAEQLRLFQCGQRFYTFVKSDVQVTDKWILHNISTEAELAKEQPERAGPSRNDVVPAIQGLERGNPPKKISPRSTQPNSEEQTMDQKVEKSASDMDSQPPRAEKLETRSEHQSGDNRIDEEGQVDKLTDLLDLRLSLRCELAAPEIRLQELEAWKPGAVIPLSDLDLNEAVAVTVKLENQKVAIGTLVRVDRRLAVRLDKVLFQASDNQQPIAKVA